MPSTEYALLPDVWDKMRALLQAAQDVQSAYQDVKDVHSASRVTYISGFGSSSDGAEEEELQDGEEEAEKSDRFHLAKENLMRLLHTADDPASLIGPVARARLDDESNHSDELIGHRADIWSTDLVSRVETDHVVARCRLVLACTFNSAVLDFVGYMHRLNAVQNITRGEWVSQMKRAVSISLRHREWTPELIVQLARLRPPESPPKPRSKSIFRRHVDLIPDIKDTDVRAALLSTLKTTLASLSAAMSSRAIGSDGIASLMMQHVHRCHFELKDGAPEHVTYDENEIDDRFYALEDEDYDHVMGIEIKDVAKNALIVATKLEAPVAVTLQLVHKLVSEDCKRHDRIADCDAEQRNGPSEYERFLGATTFVRGWFSRLNFAALTSADRAMLLSEVASFPQLEVRHAFLEQALTWIQKVLSQQHETGEGAAEAAADARQICEMLLTPKSSESD